MSLSRAEVEATVSSIARVQLPDGAIPWSAGGHVDPWNHVEAAMALDVGGRHAEARHAYRWLAATQRPDGAWPSSVRGERVEDATLDANFCAYIATGVWHHMLATGDGRFVLEMWPAVERALDFVLDLQTTDGSIMWARDADHRPWPGALLTSSSCIHLSLGCGVRLAAIAGDERPD